MKFGRLPIRRHQFDAGGFSAWLLEQGAEIAKQTNPYEVVRYRAYSTGSRKPLTNIVYAKDNGLLNFQGSSREHYQAFMDGLNVKGLRVLGLDKVYSTDASVSDTPGKLATKTARQREKLLARDGDECWFCGRAMAEDMTIEHLVPRSAGGGNQLANYALAHAVCNNRAANLPLVKKIDLRAKMRADLIHSHSYGDNR